jgi:aldehyde:ferredoxin oxidoreductase
MDQKNKKALIVNLNKMEHRVKSFPDLNKFIGGVGMGLKIFQNYLNQDPTVLAIGPLNGFFPFVSKTAIILDNDGVVEDIYLGGSLHTRLRFAGIDALVITGKAKTPTILDIRCTDVNFHTIETQLDSLGLPGKKSIIQVTQNDVVLDGYFKTPERFLHKKLTKKNLVGISITGEETYKPTDFEKYKELYNSLLQKKDSMTVIKNAFPSCSNCPMGCAKAKDGEIGGNVLVHSLVACQYAEKIYSDIGIVFSCLNVLGYDYTHEDIEAVPRLVENVLKELA